MDTALPAYRRLQDLPPRAARFCLDLERSCRIDLGLDIAGKSLVIAYSGGADSKALFLALHFLSSRLNLTLHAATLDHGLRRESAGEVAAAAALCSRYGIPFHTDHKDVAAHAREKGMGVEEAGRDLRLRFLETVRRRTGGDWIAFGHQCNDLAEDSLMRLIRGTGWPALAGMDGVNAATRIIRPLLLTPRANIETFLRDIGESWVTDAMNEDSAYFRNRVRREILPLLLNENPSFLRAVAERWRMARADGAFFDALLGSIAVREKDGGLFLQRDDLSRLTPSLRLRKYKEILSSLGRGQVTASLLFALDTAWERNEGGKTVQFPGGKFAVVREGGVVFLKKNEAGRRPH